MAMRNDQVDPALFERAATLARSRRLTLYLTLSSAKDTWRAVIAFGSADLSTAEDADVNVALHQLTDTLPISAGPMQRHVPLTTPPAGKPPLSGRINRR